MPNPATQTNKVRGIPTGMGSRFFARSRSHVLGSVDEVDGRSVAVKLRHVIPKQQLQIADPWDSSPAVMIFCSLALFFAVVT
jgi:hypothetical protein